MRGSSRALVVLLTLLLPLLGATSPAGAALIVEGKPPLQPPLPGYPQLSCTIVLERAEDAWCEVEGRVGSVNEVHVRIAGRVSGVHVLVTAPDSLTSTQVAAFDCTRTCVVSVPSTSGTADIYMTAKSWGVGSVTVSLEADLVGVP